MWRRVRILLLLFVLASVALAAWRTRARATEWRNSLQVAIYPILADDSPVTRAYVASLDEATFEDIETWAQRETMGYGRSVLRPVDVSLARAATEAPPAPPRDGGAAAIAAWSLRLRYWAWRHDQAHKPTPQVKLFVLYHDPARSPAVPHSLGLEKGQIGVVHVFAARAQAAQNSVVIAHELLHTLGATDKYDPQTGQPRHPEGYAEPNRQPIHPQTRAEIMGGRTPLSPREARIPDALADTVIGPATAREIGLAPAH